MNLLISNNLSGRMSERHAARKGSADKCSVAGCGEPAVKSVSAKEAVRKADLSVEDKSAGRAHLCRHHYREYKKATKTDRELDRLAW